MKVLVATNKTQGFRNSDFCHTIDELVTLPMECDSDKDNIDGGCGCRRSFAGIKSHRATTTAMVVERKITPKKYRECFVDEPDVAWQLASIARSFEVGTILEKRGDNIQEREYTNKEPKKKAPSKKSKKG